jgi:hypothetical protein
MDINNSIVQLSLQGMRVEFEHRVEDARAFYGQAWDVRTDDYDACIAAHYVARFHDSAEESLRWNQIALEHANTVNDGRVNDFYPSPYLNLGRSYELLGNKLRRRDIMILPPGWELSISLIQSPASHFDRRTLYFVDRITCEVLRPWSSQW